MSSTKTRLAALEKQFRSMIPPGEVPVTFIFEDGERLTFSNAHKALIFAIANSDDKRVQKATIETKEPDKVSLAKAVLACGSECKE